MTYRQLYSDRLKRHHKLQEIEKEEHGKGKIVIRLGTIILPKGKRISEKLVKDVEAVLTQDSQPEYNVLNINAYWGNRDLKITNLGNYEPLSRTIDTTKWGQVY